MTIEQLCSATCMVRLIRERADGIELLDAGNGGNQFFYKMNLSVNEYKKFHLTFKYFRKRNYYDKFEKKKTTSETF